HRPEIGSRYLRSSFLPFPGSRVNRHHGSGILAAARHRTPGRRAPPARSPAPRAGAIPAVPGEAMSVSNRQRPFRPQLERVEDRLTPAGFVAVGSDVGVLAEVRIFTDTDANGTYETRAPAGVAVPFTFSPYPGFTGGARVALGDFDGDGNDELVTAAGPGGGPHVIVWDLNPDGTVGGVQDSFFAYPANFAGGVFVAAGDINNDGSDELVTAPDAGGGSVVEIFSDADRDGLLSDNMTDQFFAFPNFFGGVRVALGNTNNTGGDELIVGAGPGGGPGVSVYTDTDADRAVSDQPVVETFFAYPANF